MPDHRKKIIVLLGANGQLGTELEQSLRIHGEIISLSSPRDLSSNKRRLKIDLANPNEIIKILKDIRPDLVVNAAAYTKVDLAETQRDLAFTVNADLPAEISKNCSSQGFPLIHYSTDYVYQQGSFAPLKESDPTDPINFYGTSKLAGENAIRESSCQHLIFRTSWVYGVSGVNFVKKMVQLMKGHKTLEIVDDQVGSPSSARVLALSLSALLGNYHEPERFNLDNVSGTYNYAPNDFTSWFGFAKAILDHCHRLNLPVTTESVLAVDSGHFKTAARRPENSRLDTSLFVKEFKQVIPNWMETLDDEFPQIVASMTRC